VWGLLDKVPSLVHTKREMIRFPKRARTKSIDLEDGDLVVVGSPSEPDDLADTGVVPPKARSASPVAAGSSLAPVAMMARAEETFMIPRIERRPESRVSAIFAAAGQRPSMPWAAVLLALGAIGAAGSMRLLDALDGHPRGEAPAAAAAMPPAQATAFPPIAPPAAAGKPSPVVLNFGAADAVKVAVDAPKPASPPVAAPQPAPAPPPPAFAAAPVAKKPPPVVAVAPPAVAAPPPSADTVKRAAAIDTLADQQLKAALK